MTKQFLSKSIWNPSGIVNINAIKLTNFSGYDFHGAAGKVDYAVGELTDDVFTPHYNGSMDLTPELVAAWGESDEPVIDYVMNKLGLS